MPSAFDWILLNAGVATVMAIVVGALVWIPALRRRPGIQHALWILVLAKFVTPPIWEWPVLQNEQVSDESPHAAPSNAIVVATAETSVQHSSESTKVTNVVRGRTTRVNVDPAPPAPEPKAEPTDEPANIVNASINWPLAFVWFSLIGTMIVIGSSIRQIVGLNRALRRSASDDERMNAIVQQCSASMGLTKSPRVSIVSANLPPLLWVGISGPLIVLPRRLVDELTDEQLRCVVCHEMTHYRRRDHWSNLFSLLVAAMFWWNPVAWWIRRKLHSAQEACCDAMVINRSIAPRPVYAQTLFHTLEFLQTESSPLPSPAIGFGSKSSTRRRFEMIAQRDVNHRLSWWSVPLLLAVLAVLPCLPTMGLAQKGNARRSTRAVIQSVDATKGTITVQTKKNGTTTYRLSKGSRIELDTGAGQKPGNLTDLRAGIAVTLYLDGDKQVSRITAEGPTVRGILKSSDPGKGTVTVAVSNKKEAQVTSKTYQVGRKVMIFIKGGKGYDKSKPSQRPKLADLPLGTMVYLRLSVDQKTVGSIRAEGQYVSGRLKSVDAAKRTIAITVSRKGEPEFDRTYQVAKQASVTIDDGRLKDKSKPIKRRSLSELPAGARISLQLSLDGNSVVGVHAHGTTLNGRLKTIDASKRTLTLQTKTKGKTVEKGERTLPIAKDVVVFVDDKRKGTKLGDVPVGARVEVRMQADGKAVREIRAVGPTVMGRVVGDSVNNALTLGGKQGDKTYTVPDKTRIVIAGRKSGKLTDLIDGTVARLRLAVNKSTVLEVHAEGPRFQGKVKSADSQTGSLTLTIGGKNGVGGEDKPFKLSKATVITRQADKTRIKLNDVQRGSDVIVQLSIDQKSVTSVMIRGE